MKSFKQTFKLSIDNTKGAMREHDSIAIAAFKGGRLNRDDLELDRNLSHRAVYFFWLRIAKTIVTTSVSSAIISELKLIIIVKASLTSMASPPFRETSRPPFKAYSTAWNIIAYYVFGK